MVSTARVADVRVRDLVGGDGVVRRDVRAAYDARHVHELITLIESQGLVALDHQIAVRLNFHHGDGQAACQGISLRARAFTVKTIRAVQRGGENRHTRGRDGPSENGRSGVVHGSGLGGLGRRALAGVGRLGQANGQYVAHAARLEICEQFDLLALLKNGSIGARCRRRQYARDHRIGFGRPRRQKAACR